LICLKNRRGRYIKKKPEHDNTGDAEYFRRAPRALPEEEKNENIVVFIYVQ